MKNSGSEKKSSRISEGIVLALASAGAYLFAFYYEKGFASVFKIPTSLISVNLSSVLLFGAIFIGVIMAILPAINLILSITIGQTHPTIQRAVIPVIIFLAFLLIQIYLFGLANWKNWIYIFVMLIMLLFFQFVFPLITQKGKTYIAKLEAQENTDRQVIDTYDLLQRKFGNEALHLIFIFLAGLVVAMNAGISEAIRQDEFLVTNTTPELVVLRVYSENLIGVPFDRTTGEIEQSFHVIKNSGEHGLVLTLEKLGNLHLPTPHPTFVNTETPTPSSTSTPTVIAP